jgi:hypothetical protein
VAVISLTSNWVYVVFAALGAWVGSYATMKYLRWRSRRDAVRDAAMGDVVAAHGAHVREGQAARHVHSPATGGRIAA